MATEPEIDWSAHDQYPKDEIECGCGARFMAHCKGIGSDKFTFRFVTREPCPACGRCDNVRAARGAWESQIIRK